MKKIFALLLSVVMVASLLCACGTKPADNTASSDAGSSDVASNSDLAYIQQKGKLVVGITEFNPMDYKDADGKWIGFDADMATAFASSLGVSVEFVEIDWDNKIMELNGKTIDCVWNGMTLTDEVKTSMSTSDPYCNNAQVVIVKAADAAKYQTADACKDLQFAVEAGSAGESQAIANGFKYTSVKDQATALTEVAAGTCNAAIIDSLMAAAMVGEGTGYKDLTYTVGLNSEEYGVGFRKDSDLTAKLNEFFVKCEADGTTLKTAETYGVQASLIK